MKHRLEKQKTLRHRGLDGTTLHLAYLHEASPVLHVDVESK